MGTHEDPSQATPKTWAAGVPAVVKSLRYAVGQMGPARTARGLLKLNQDGGFDCPSCAWPDPDGSGRHRAEFCENGAKALAWEATESTVDRAFFAEHSIADLHAADEYWLGQQGRLTEPMYRRPNGTHYEPITWTEAQEVIVRHLRAGPADDVAFYTSGRTSNEAAFLYQLMVRAYGTNNLPDCSNMCHESSGVAMTEQIGIGKGAVTLESLEAAELIVVVGQNPGTNAPRMLSSLERAKERGAVIVSINPLPEAGLARFKNPQTVKGVVGEGTRLADDHLQIRLGGDHALFQAVAHLLLAAEVDSPGTVLDADFINIHTEGFEEYAEARAIVDWPMVLAATGLTRSEIEGLAQRFVDSRATVVCWAMGLTQHVRAVPTIQEIVSVLLLQGNIGKRGAGPCPVRGHSNVQGDRSMGIWERPTEPFLAALDAEFGFTSPREPGLDVTATVRRLRAGDLRVFFALGGNFATATPDTAVVLEGLRRTALTVQISTKLNRSHTAVGAEALILPCLARSDRDESRLGRQAVTVEDSQGQVHRSQGVLVPPSPHCRSEIRIIAELAAALVPDVGRIDWERLAHDHDRIRDHIAAVVPGYDDYNTRVRQRDGFLLGHGPRDHREFPTPSGRAHFFPHPVHALAVPPGRLLLQTLRSHDQFNTTVYAYDDRYRGIYGDRNVVLVNPDDLTDLGIEPGARVRITSEHPDGERSIEGFTAVAYPTARGCAAAYFPEANALMATDHVAEGSHTPVAKAIVIRLEVMAPTVGSGSAIG